jgi:pentatricopeptide repeat protein
MAVSHIFSPATDDQEREMSRHQRSLVDTCFEEGQYESGISVLEQLRSSQFKPAE